MKRTLFGVMAVLMMLSLVVLPASAQTISPWATGVDLQNLSDVEATYLIEFYRPDGTLAYTYTPANKLAARGSANVYIPNLASLPAGQYASVVSSDQLIAAVASINSYSAGNPEFGGGDIYLGTASPADTLIFPLAYRNHTTRKWYSSLHVQNASAAAQSVTLKLYNSGSSAVAVSKTVSIPANATFAFNLEDAEYAAFGPYGGAVVTGSAPLAGVAFSLTKGRMTNPATNYLDTMNTEYRAFTTAQLGRDVVAPLVYRNYNLWTTGINVVNNSATATQVTVTYTNANPAVSGGPWTETKTVVGNGMEVFYTPSTAGLPDGFFGSATIASASTDIAVVVASQRYRATGAEGVAYEGQVPSAATQCVSLPVSHNRTTWKTGINILNLGGAEGTFTLNYSSSAPGIPNAGPQTVTIAANSPKTIYMPTESPTALGFYGAVDIKGTQPFFVVAANSRNDATSHGVASNYVGINYTCP